MIGKIHSICLVLPISLVFALFTGNVAHADRAASALLSRAEVFTTVDLPITHETDRARLHFRGIDLQIYGLDVIQRIEAKLSQGLTADPEQSKRVVLQRFQELHEEDRVQMQRAAMGLAKAMQYGIDRYPAIVFDGEAAVYGVTDIDEALHRYQRWREGRKR